VVVRAAGIAEMILGCPGTRKDPSFPGALRDRGRWGFRDRSGRGTKGRADIYLPRGGGGTTICPRGTLRERMLAYPLEGAIGSVPSSFKSCRSTASS